MASGSNSTFSVIGSDVKIKGDISASADLHVDGTIEGDIKCSSLVQGESSQIMGGVMAETARFSGRVNGSITARELVILKTAEIQGDVHYDALTIEQGAQVDGRFAPNSQRQSAKAAAKPAEPVEKPKAEQPDQAQLKIAT
ncbi:MAG: polymer-forming cytoskeletal protein [Erythrobacter sp.]|nr:polymer-forming cytoskeletal protein [Erythrobacter sp.]